MSEPEITAFACGPSSPTCRCACPESCEHSWDGPWVESTGFQSVTCSRCGLDAFQHDRWLL